jgi:hypothetical protein
MGGILAFITTPWMPSMCPMRLVLHVPCPACGLTRAARCLLHLDVAGATRLHPLWWAVLPYVGTLAALEAVSYVRTGKTGQWVQQRVTGQVGMVLLAAMVVVWGARAMGALGGPVPI